MAPSLKEKLSATPDINEKEEVLKTAKDMKIKIRRLTVGERDEIFQFRDKIKSGDLNAASDVSKNVVARGLVEPTTTVEEIKDLPSLVIEEIATKIMAFNGWDLKSQKALEDTFSSPG